MANVTVRIRAWEGEEIQEDTEYIENYRSARDLEKVKAVLDLFISPYFHNIKVKKSMVTTKIEIKVEAAEIDEILYEQDIVPKVILCITKHILKHNFQGPIVILQ
ncbi:MAG: hypothetical protein ACRCYY_04940 [Trueperaceae bacterium]